MQDNERAGVANNPVNALEEVFRKRAANWGLWPPRSVYVNLCDFCAWGQATRKSVIFRKIFKIILVLGITFRLFPPSSLACSFLFLYGSTDLWTLTAFSESQSYMQSVGLLGLGISQSQDRYLYMTTLTQNKCTQTSMPRAGFEPTIPVFELAKAVHALDCAATVIGFTRV
jgi:hypothetical protein